jgi:diguanylate cyclase (GGDEF)-like protein
VNDIWGHQVGDRAIAAFGAMTQNMIRASDIAGRVGGEEFCVLVWKADKDIAAGLSERLRKRTSELDISQGALDVRLTASFGVAERQPHESYRSLFARADKALYEAKQSGRNCVKRADASDAAAPETSANAAAKRAGTNSANLAA